MKKRRIVALACTAAVLLLAVSAFGYIQSKLDKINKVSDTVDIIPPEQEDFETDTSNEPKDIIELKPEEVDWSEIEPFLDDDLLNILLVGQDRREGEGRQRSDSMILCSINPDTKQISMISFLRDLYVQIPGGYSDNRLNAAYLNGWSKVSPTCSTASQIVRNAYSISAVLRQPHIPKRRRRWIMLWSSSQSTRTTPRR